MYSKKFLLLSAALLGGVLSTSAFATTADAHARVTKAAFEAPVVTKLVSPVGVSRRLEGETVMLSLTIDASGQPSDIKIVSRSDRALAGNLVSVVSQWRFTPAKKNGVPVTTKVMLPIELSS